MLNLSRYALSFAMLFSLALLTGCTEDQGAVPATDDTDVDVVVPDADPGAAEVPEATDEPMDEQPAGEQPDAVDEPDVTGPTETEDPIENPDVSEEPVDETTDAPPLDDADEEDQQ